FGNLREGISKAAAGGKGRMALGIDSFCNDFGLLAKDGRLMTQVRSYRDERTIRTADAIFRKVPKKELYMKTGCQIAPFNTSMQMASMVIENEGYLLENCDKALLIPDLLTYFLSGEKITEYTLASVTQLLDPFTDRWQEELFERFGIRKDIFAPVTPSETKVGKIDFTLNPEMERCDVDIITVGGHDTASAVAALPSSDEREAYISSGTWSLVGTLVPKPVLTDQSYGYNICYEGGMDHRYRMQRNVMGLWIMQECAADFERKTRRKYDYEYFNAETAKAKPLACFIDPNADEFFSPGDMTAKVRNYCGKTGQHVPETLGEVLRCVYDSLAMTYRFYFEVMEDILGYRFSRIRILGGGGQNRFLNQAVADACGKEVFAGPFEAALIGNILMQMKCTGEIGSSEEGREIIGNSFPPVRYEPEAAGVWNEAYFRFKEICGYDGHGS
ncbi:MAG: rhamnulokinase, partial [Eubacterium sp.]|nr:rhamnulokinase [Eubacterium sp.]